MPVETVASVPHGLRPTFEAVQAAPAAIAVLAPTLFGYKFSDVAALLGCVFLVLQMVYLIWRWHRDMRREDRRERELAREAARMADTVPAESEL